MADDSTKTFPVANGEIYKAATSTSAPTSAISSLSSWTDGLVGFISENGVTFTPSREVQDNKAFQNATVVNTQQTSFKLTVDFEMLEYNEVTAGIYHGNVTHIDTTSFSSTMSGASFGHFSWLIDFTDGSLKKVRFYIPDAKVTEQQPEVYKNGDQAFWGVTLTSYPDASGINYYKWVDHDITVSA